MLLYPRKCYIICFPCPFEANNIQNNIQTINISILLHTQVHVWDSLIVLQTTLAKREVLWKGARRAYSRQACSHPKVGLGLTRMMIHYHIPLHHPIRNRTIMRTHVYNLFATNPTSHNKDVPSKLDRPRLGNRMINREMNVAFEEYDKFDGVSTAGNGYGAIVNVRLGLGTREDGLGKDEVERR
jgi:hypothetical protein